jgi:hypothetical protein
MYSKRAGLRPNELKTAIPWLQKRLACVEMLMQQYPK